MCFGIVYWKLERRVGCLWWGAGKIESTGASKNSVQDGFPVVKVTAQFALGGRALGVSKPTVPVLGLLGMFGLEV